MKQVARIAKWAIAGLVIALAAIQLVPVERANPPVETEIPAPVEVRSILRKACYDCHSNETVWPWYSRIAPISWMLARDVREGRAELNYSTWNQYSAKQQAKKLKESWTEVAEGEMPPWFYLPSHPEARLSPEDRAALEAWSRSAIGPGPQGG